MSEAEIIEEMAELSLQREAEAHRRIIDAAEIRLIEALNHQRIHHGAEIRLIKAEHDDLLEKLSTLVTIAQAGLAKNKPHVTEYQLDRMYDLLGETNA